MLMRNDAFGNSRPYPRLAYTSMTHTPMRTSSTAVRRHEHMATTRRYGFVAMEGVVCQSTPSPKTGGESFST